MNQFLGPGGQFSRNKLLYTALAASAALLIFAIIFSAIRAVEGSNPVRAKEAPPIQQQSDPPAEASLGADGADAPTPSSAKSGGNMKLTVPKMKRIKDDPIPTTAGNDENGLKQNAGIHVEGTGMPWQKNSNVYIAGHRLGFPGTESYLAFWDLNVLEKGDQILITRDSGDAYAYEVTKKMIVKPTDTSVVAPVEGKDVLTLQTCTLPDYSERLIVRAEKVV